MEKQAIPKGIKALSGKVTGVPKEIMKTMDKFRTGRGLKKFDQAAGKYDSMERGLKQFDALNARTNIPGASPSGAKILKLDEMAINNAIKNKQGIKLGAEYIKSAGYFNVPEGPLDYNEAMSTINRLPYETFLEGFPGGADFTTDELRKAVLRNLAEKDFTPLRGALGGGALGGGVGAGIGALLGGRKGALLGSLGGAATLGGLAAFENRTHIKDRGVTEGVLENTKSDSDGLAQIAELLKLPLEDRVQMSLLRHRPEWADAGEYEENKARALGVGAVAGAGAGGAIGKLLSNQQMKVFYELIAGLKGRTPGYLPGNAESAIRKLTRLRGGSKMIGGAALGGAVGYGAVKGLVGRSERKKDREQLTKEPESKLAGLNFIKTAYDPKRHVDTDLVPYMSDEELLYNMITGAQGRAMDDPSSKAKAAVGGGAVGGGLGALFGAIKGLPYNTTIQSRKGRMGGGVVGAGLGALGGAGIGALLAHSRNKDIQGAQGFLQDDIDDPRKMNELIYKLKAKAAHEQDARRKPEVNVSQKMSI